MARAYPQKYGKYLNWSDNRWRAAWDRIWAQQGGRGGRNRNQNNPFQQAVNAGLHPALMPQMNPQVQAARANQAAAAQNPKVAMWQAFGQNPQLFDQARRANIPQWGGPVGQWMWDNFQTAGPNMARDVTNFIANTQRENIVQRNFLRNLDLQRQKQIDERNFRNRMLDMMSGNFGTGADAMVKMSENIGKGLGGLDWVNLAGGQGVRHKGETPILSQDIPRVNVARRSNARRRGGTGGALGVPGGSDAGKGELLSAVDAARGSGGTPYAAATGDSFDDALTGLETGRAATVAKDIQQQLGTSTKAKGDKTKNLVAGLRADATVQGAQRRAHLNRIGAGMNMLTGMMGNMWG